ncbi:MAG: carbohydrate kinase [Lachnospiraceae bacterium]|nr:carbohydrate kinase [Lachnospiraceae bacterium]
MKKYDVTALGELLIDLTQNGMSPQGNPMLEANPGGAPCNVLALLTKLGHNTAFIGKVGKDGFGDQLEDALKEVGIATEGLGRDDQVHTTLAVVHTFADGDRDFSFYRNPGADMMLTKEEVKMDLIRDSKIFHFGTLSMTDEPVRSATYAAIEEAEKNGVLRSFDPNLRPPLWKTLEDAKVQVLYGMAHCDILKISDNEIQWLTGLEDFDEGINWIKERFPQIRLILLSMGKDGSRAYSGETMAEAGGFTVDTIETTGAGDTFFGGVLHYVLEHELRSYTEEELKEMLTFANAGAAIVTTKKGALRVMPSQQEIQALIDGK